MSECDTFVKSHLYRAFNSLQWSSMKEEKTQIIKKFLYTREMFFVIHRVYACTP